MKSIVNECVKAFLKENKTIENLKFELGKYLGAIDRLTQENRMDLAMQCLEKVESILLQIRQHPEYDGTEYMNRENFQHDETLKNGAKFGSGPEMFGRGREFGRK